MQHRRISEDWSNINTPNNGMFKNVIKENKMYYKTTQHQTYCIKTNFETDNNYFETLAVHKTQKVLQKIYTSLQPFKNNYEQQYFTFKIPKRHGGLREISAPNEEFKAILKHIKELLEYEIRCLPHNAAYAYIKHRSALDAVQKHKHNNWFLKIDLHNFFPSITVNNLANNLYKLHPFQGALSHMIKGMDKLREILQICSLHGGLPQGTPLSPYLSNLFMVPFDYTLTKELRKINPKIVYTRYADDILISFPDKTLYSKDIIEIISNILKDTAPGLEINHTKTRFGSIAGQNWNLGLMLNKDRNITVGHSRKREINAMVNNCLAFPEDYTIEDKQHIQGVLGYLKHIEPEYYNNLKNKYQEKYANSINIDILK